MHHKEGDHSKKKVIYLYKIIIFDILENKEFGIIYTFFNNAYSIYENNRKSIL